MLSDLCAGHNCVGYLPVLNTKNQDNEVEYGVPNLMYFCYLVLGFCQHTLLAKFKNVQGGNIVKTFKIVQKIDNKFSVKEYDFCWCAYTFCRKLYWMLGFVPEI